MMATWTLLQLNPLFLDKVLEVGIPPLSWLENDTAVDHYDCVPPPQILSLLENSIDDKSYTQT